MRGHDTLRKVVVAASFLLVSLHLTVPQPREHDGQDTSHQSYQYDPTGNAESEVQNLQSDSSQSRDKQHTNTEHEKILPPISGTRFQQNFDDYDYQSLFNDEVLETHNIMKENVNLDDPLEIDDIEQLLTLLSDAQEMQGSGRITRRAVIEHGEGGIDAVLRRFSFTNSLNRLHSIMKIPELIRAQGYPSEVHKVVTADGYILELHRIPGPRIVDQIVLPERKSNHLRKRAFQKRSTDVPTRQKFNFKENRSRHLNLSNLLKKFNDTSRETYENDHLSNIISNRLLDEVLISNKTNEYGEYISRNRNKRSFTNDGLLESFGFTNPFRSITNLALPLINKPRLTLNPRVSSNKPASRLVKFAAPSPPRTKRIFKNSSSSIDFSGRRDLEVSNFFGTTEGDSGASGRPVVIIHHGLLSSSANFVLNDAHEAFAYLLADTGYDVWLANWRGNSYSRGHVRLDPDHSDYWNFSLDEVIRYDIPAIFKYILRKTRQEQLYFIGHSLGCVMFWGATNYDPSLNDKVKLMVAMAPAGFMDNSEGLMKIGSLAMKKYYRIFESFGIRELFVPNTMRTTLFNSLCGPQNPLMKICYTLLPLYIGEVRGSHDPYYTDVFLSHFPGGSSSVRILAQFGQFIGAGGMQMFDHGKRENWRRYGQVNPPKYSFKTVTTPVAVMWGMADTVTTAKDVALCVRSLPNVVLNKRVSDLAFNHIDFFFSEHAIDQVYLPVLKLLQKY